MEVKLCSGRAAIRQPDQSLALRQAWGHRWRRFCRNRVGRLTRERASASTFRLPNAGSPLTANHSRFAPIAAGPANAAVPERDAMPARNLRRPRTVGRHSASQHEPLRSAIRLFGMALHAGWSNCAPARTEAIGLLAVGQRGRRLDRGQEIAWRRRSASCRSPGSDSRRTWPQSRR